MYMVLCGWPSYLIWAGSLVDSARVFIMLLSLGLVRHTIGLVHGCHVVHQGDGLHSLMYSTADGLAYLSGCWSPGRWKVMGGLKRNTERSVIKKEAIQESEKSYNTVFLRGSFSLVKVFLEREWAAIVADRINNLFCPQKNGVKLNNK